MRAKLGVLAVGVVLALAGSGSAWARPGAQATGAQSDWLTEINYWRGAADLPPVADQPAWDQGIQAHLTYLEDTPASLRTGDYASAHTENPQSPYYTAAGATEAGDSDLDLGGASSAVQAIDDWLSAPFHAIGMLRAHLTQVAFADDSAGYAGLDVIQGLNGSASPTWPILFPGPGSTTDLALANDGEVPSPLETCGWQGLSVGLPLIALLTEPPDPELTASLSGPTGPESTVDGSLCLVDEDTYRTSDPVYGPTGASILRGDHAVLLIPRAPLADGTYSVDIRQPNQPDITWSFAAEISPPADIAAPAIGGWFVDGGQLTAYPGTWTNTPSSFAEQWLRCDATGANCNPIPGATGASYDLTDADVGATIRVQVTASNSGGPGQPADSAPTSPIYGDAQPTWPGGGSGTSPTGGGAQPHRGAVSRPRILRITTSPATIRVRLSGSHLVCRLARRVH